MNTMTRTFSSRRSSSRTSNLQKVTARCVRPIKIEHDGSSVGNWRFQGTSVPGNGRDRQTSALILDVFFHLSPDDDFDGCVQREFVDTDGDSSVSSCFTEDFCEQVGCSI